MATYAMFATLQGKPAVLKRGSRFSDDYDWDDSTDLGILVGELDDGVPVTLRLWAESDYLFFDVIVKAEDLPASVTIETYEAYLQAQGLVLSVPDDWTKTPPTRHAITHDLTLQCSHRS